MSDETRTNPDAMDAHADKLTGEITSALDKAHQASTETPLDEGAMGALCRVWAFIFNEERRHAEAMLEQMPRTTEETGRKVKEASQDFRTRDEDAAETLRKAANG